MSLQKLKTYMMPIAMLIGGIFYSYLEPLSFCIPYLIGTMLFISYSNISWREIHVSRLHICLLLVQIIGSLAIFLIIRPFDLTIAQGVMVCVLAPTATSAVVITGMLGGNMASLTTYSIVSNIAVAFSAPIIFSLIGEGGNGQEMSFVTSLLSISKRVFILLLGPFFLAVLLGEFFPKAHQIIRRLQGLSFYLWSFALIVVTARTVKFVMTQDESNYTTEIIIALAALVVCIAQFVIGRSLGRKYDNTIAGGQGLGQKNTILAIWMAQTYLSPIASIGPGAYILWQNIINSFQVWRNARKQ